MIDLQCLEETIRSIDDVTRLHHEPGCEPHRDPRVACACTALVVEPGIGAILRPPGCGGANVLEVAQSINAKAAP